MVGLGGSAEAVDGLGRGLDGGVEAEGELGHAEVVVDGLGDADDGDAIGGEPAGDAQGVVAADGDEGVDALAFEGGADGLGAALDGVGVGAGGAEDGAAEGQDVAAAPGVEGHQVALHDARPAVAEASDLVAVLALALGDDGADDGVEPGAVAPAGQDAHAHGGPSAKGLAMTVAREDERGERRALRMREDGAVRR